MTIKSTDNQLIKLREFQKKNKLSVEEVAKHLHISKSLLEKMYGGSRFPTDQIRTSIERLIIKNQKDIVKNYTEKHAEDRISTVEEEMVKTLNLTGENTKFDILQKTDFIIKLGEMRERGLLKEEDFNRLINKLMDTI